MDNMVIAIGKLIQRRGIEWTVHQNLGAVDTGMDSPAFNTAMELRKELGNPLVCIMLESDFTDGKKLTPLARRK